MSRRDRRLIELENTICVNNSTNTVVDNEDSENVTTVIVSNECNCEHLQNCSRNGRCINGGCFCNEGYWGDKCERVICPNNCSIKGEEQIKYEYEMNYKYELDQITLSEYNALKQKIPRLFSPIY